MGIVKSIKRTTEFNEYMKKARKQQKRKMPTIEKAIGIVLVKIQCTIRWTEPKIDCESLNFLYNSNCHFFHSSSISFTNSKWKTAEEYCFCHLQIIMWNVLILKANGNYCCFKPIEFYASDVYNLIGIKIEMIVHCYFFRSNHTSCRQGICIHNAQWWCRNGFCWRPFRFSAFRINQDDQRSKPFVLYFNDFAFHFHFRLMPTSYKSIHGNIDFVCAVSA